MLRSITTFPRRPQSEGFCPLGSLVAVEQRSAETEPVDKWAAAPTQTRQEILAFY